MKNIQRLWWWLFFDQLFVECVEGEFFTQEKNFWRQRQMQCNNNQIIDDQNTKIYIILKLYYLLIIPVRTGIIGTGTWYLSNSYHFLLLFTEYLFF